MRIKEILFNKKVLCGLLTITLIVMIFTYSGGIVTSIFDYGRELGNVVGNILFG